MERNLYNRHALEDLLNRIEKLQWRTEAQWGQMNVNQAICHMTDPLRDLLNRREIDPVVPSFISPLMRMMVLTKKDWKPGTPTLKIYDQIKGDGTRPTAFDYDKKLLVSMLSELAEKSEDYKFGRHPALGKLNRDQLGFFVWKHVDHHLRQFGC